MSTVMRIHPDTYPLYLSGFLSYDGVTMPQSHDWDDAHIPRTDRPVRFQYDRVGRDKFGSVLNVYWPYASLGWRYSR
jgi:hypothetical protein